MLKSISVVGIISLDKAHHLSISAIYFRHLFINYRKWFIIWWSGEYITRFVTSLAKIRDRVQTNDRTKHRSG